MKGDALLFMLFSWGLVLGLCTFCFKKLFSARKHKEPRQEKDPLT
jgi:hypothetical protein